jgi:very-short-patch-repair endonuclease
MSNEKQHRIYPPILQAARELRQPQTPAEQKLWSRLRNHQIEIACPASSGIDGDSHAEQMEYDQARTAYFNERGYTVIHFTNREVFNQCEAVLQRFADECQRRISAEHIGGRF